MMSEVGSVPYKIGDPDWPADGVKKVADTMTMFTKASVPPSLSSVLSLSLAVPLSRFLSLCRSRSPPFFRSSSHPCPPAPLPSGPWSLSPCPLVPCPCRYPKPVVPAYRSVVNDILVTTHLTVIQKDFKYDPIFALGMVTIFDNFFKAYPPPSEVN